MSYNVSRQVNPDISIISASSTTAGYVNFAFDSGSFIPTISTNMITLEAGFEYFIVTALASATNASTSYFTEVDGVANPTYSLSALSFESGKDEQWDSIQADAPVEFKVSCNQITSSNSRIIVWRFPL